MNNCFVFVNKSFLGKISSAVSYTSLIFHIFPLFQPIKYECMFLFYDCLIASFMTFKCKLLRLCNKNTFEARVLPKGIPTSAFDCLNILRLYKPKQFLSF